MSTNKPDIALIRKYLNGELDARAMYDLERQAHNDPFLMDVILGMEMEVSNEEDHQQNLDAIDGLIKERIQQDKKRTIPLWKLLPIAASLLIALTIGGWWLMRQHSEQSVVFNHKPVEQPDKVKVEVPLPVAKPVEPSENDNQLAKLNRRHSKSAISSAAISDQPIKADTMAMPSIAANDKTAGFKKAEDAKNFGYIANAQPKLNKEAPGSLYEVRIRGNSTIKGKEPLYIVDGLAADSFKINSIKPSDIKSINILKDASATAVYGSRAANGVILINTKKGLLASNEVNIIGYGTQRKTTVTGSVASISSVELNKPDTTINQMLMGRVAGVSVSRGKSKKANTALIITGKVVDKHDGSPLPGVAVSVAGNQTSTVTDVEGNFKITVPNKETLNIAYIGYESQQIKIKNKDNLNIALAPASNSLSEVVVVGYGTLREPADVVSEDARPAIGWKAYNQYLKQQTVVAAGKAGKIKLTFTIDNRGNIINIRIVKGLTEDLNQKAIDILKNGSKWIDDHADPGKEIKMKIKFHQ